WHCCSARGTLFGKPRARAHRFPHFAAIPNGATDAAHVRFGSKADMCTAPAHVRFTPKSGHEMAICDLRSLSVSLEPKMSALTPKAGSCSSTVHVRFTPESRHWHP